MLRPELSYLRRTGFLNADKILYTVPGLHENPGKLDRQLKRQIVNAKRHSQKVVVIFGEGCYIDSKDPFRGIDKLLQETGDNVKRIKAKNCIDMFVDSKERENISRGQKVYWLSPGWLNHWRIIFKDWDRGKANETFPRLDKAILLDSMGIFDEYSTNSPEKVLEFSDWMRLSIEPYKISLDRLERLLTDSIF